MNHAKVIDDLPSASTGLRFRSHSSSDELVGEMRSLNPFPIRYLHELTVGAQVRPLRAPVMVRVELDGARFSAFAPLLHLGAVGDSVESALSEVAKTIEHTWRELSATRPGDLHPSALVQFHRLRLLFGT